MGILAVNKKKKAMNKVLVGTLLVGGIILVVNNISKAAGNNSTIEDAAKEMPRDDGSSLLTMPRKFTPTVPLELDNLHSPFAAGLRNRLTGKTESSGYSRGNISSSQAKLPILVQTFIDKFK